MRTSHVLATSSGLGWTSIAAELRENGVGEVSGIIPKSVEIFLVLAGNTDGLVRRCIGGHWQDATPRAGSIWLSPAGLSKDIAITAPIPKTAHFYLPGNLFDSLRDDLRLPSAPAASIRNEAGARDEVIESLGRSIVSELSLETAAGRLYVEYASLTLAARLLRLHCDSGACGALESARHRIDKVRLRRVLDYIDVNIRHDIHLEDLARVAGYSVFYFARQFTATVGVPPHRYISQIRMQSAMEELAGGALSIAEIALNAHFSSQASFTRTFHRILGVTPMEYRRRRL